MAANNLRWRKDEDKMLTELWALKTLSVREIADRLNRSIEAINKHSRLLRLRDANAPAAAEARSDDDPVIVWQAPLEVAPMVVVGRASTCQWPLWGNKERPPRPPRFCGAPSEFQSYCLEHAIQKCYSPPQHLLALRASRRQGHE